MKRIPELPGAATLPWMKFVAPCQSRLDKTIASATPELSRVKAGALVRKGCVLVNGRVALKPARIVRSGDEVEVTDAGERATESSISPVNLQLKILYEDADCLVIAKPAGIAMHPAPGIKKTEPTILHGIASLFQKNHIPFSASSVLVHRLDRETTGCLLIAKSPQAHTFLQKQFKDRTIRKTYLAIVSGIPAQSDAHIDAPIGRHVSERTKMSVMGATHSREAQTTYHVLSVNNEPGSQSALLACDLHTGRTHQIRVHLGAIGHHVLGDKTYTSPESEKISQKCAIDHLCLHSWKLSFRSPAISGKQSVQSPVPATFTKTLRLLKLKPPSEKTVE